MTEKQILADLGAGQITAAQAEELLEKAREKPITCKQGEKGGISVYGLQRFPVTLYSRQWRRIFEAANAAKILAFCDEVDAAKAAAEAVAAAAAA